MSAKVLLRGITAAVFLFFAMSVQAQTPPRDDANWKSYGVGTNAEVYTIHTNRLHMYLGGAFTEFEGRPAQHVVHFNTEFWESLGGGVEFISIK